METIIPIPGSSTGEEEGLCFVAVKAAQIREQFSGLMNVYIPTCNQDGSFTALQCGM